MTREHEFNATIEVVRTLITTQGELGEIKTLADAASYIVKRIDENTEMDMLHLMNRLKDDGIE